MTDTIEATPILPTHIEDTIASIAKLHAEHYQQATPLQRATDRLTALVGQPRFIGVLSASLAIWMIGNLAAPRFHLEPADPPPFVWVGTVCAIVALYVTVLILSTQRRENSLAQLREQLTLELAILSEQKTAKTIELLEEMRRDSPHLRDRVDEEAAAMAIPADPGSVLEAIKETHAEAEVISALPDGSTLNLEESAAR